VNFTTFQTNLATLQNGIAITAPIALQVKRSYWGAPPQAITDLPCIINDMTESERDLGFGTRDQHLRVNVQCLVAKATVEDARSSLLATAFWFAAKNRFDSDLTIGGSVSLTRLLGAEPTVPVILMHAGQAYFGFNAYLDIIDAENFTFG